MIKLNRLFTPLGLSPAFIKAQTLEFKTNGTNVWNVNWLKESLLQLSFQKCAYCECSLSVESNYMEVEHFEDKSDYPDKVLIWENLIPSCKKCNGSKSTHDVNKEPIVNPFIDNPSDEFYFRLYKIKGIKEKGIRTESILNLNHPERAIKKRFEIGEALENLIEQAFERLINFEESSTVLRRNKLNNIVEEILQESQPESIYSATCATILHSCLRYNEIKIKMEKLGLWTSEFDNLHEKSKEIVLEMK